MLQYLFLMTRVYLLNFGVMWALPVLAFAAMLLFRLLWGGKQPCKGLLLIMPAAYVVVSIVNAYLCAVDNIALVSLIGVLGGAEVVLLFGWLGLLLGTVIGKLTKREKGDAHAE